MFTKNINYFGSLSDAKGEKLKTLVEFGMHKVRYSNFSGAYGLLKEALELCDVRI